MPADKETSEFEEDFKPKTAKRKIDKKTLIAAAIALGVVGLAFAIYFIYQGYHYYKTDNAHVETEIHQLTANASGKLVRVYVSEGEQVEAGKVLARVVHGPFVIAPSDGVVIDVRMHEGDYVSASDVIVIVAETGNIYIKANVEESDILKIQTGQEVSVFLDVYGRSFDGYVQEVNTITTNRLSGGATSFTTSGTYTKVTQLIPVRIKLRDDLDLANIIGTNATVKIRIR